MVTFPPCKINLGLHVTTRRPDGYHEIDTCFYPVAWTDILEAIPGEELSFSSSGLSIPGDQNDNLCLKAYRLLRSTFQIPAANFHLHKSIPTGAGLGGGSSDAAWTLRMLNEMFYLGIAHEKLKALAAELGSDCSFFIEDQPQYGQGRGELLRPAKIDLHEFFLAIIIPDIHISTSEAFAGIVPRQPKNAIQEIIEGVPVDLWKEHLFNDFETTVFRKFPQVELIKERCYQHGATYASLSGSGSAVFGLFRQPPVLRNKFPGCVYWEGKL